MFHVLFVHDLKKILISVKTPGLTISGFSVHQRSSSITNECKTECNPREPICDVKYNVEVCYLTLKQPK